VGNGRYCPNASMISLTRASTAIAGLEALDSELFKSDDYFEQVNCWIGFSKGRKRILDPSAKILVVDYFEEKFADDPPSLRKTAFAIMEAILRFGLSILQKQRPEPARQPEYF
jgi:hypothetical protein